MSFYSIVETVDFLSKENLIFKLSLGGVFVYIIISLRVLYNVVLLFMIELFVQ